MRSIILKIDKFVFGIVAISLFISAFITWDQQEELGATLLKLCVISCIIYMAYVFERDRNINHIKLRLKNYSIAGGVVTFFNMPQYQGNAIFSLEYIIYCAYPFLIVFVSCWVGFIIGRIVKPRIKVGDELKAKGK